MPVAAAEPKSPEELRLVSLVPSFTETLFAVGAGGQLSGVSSYCDYPLEAKALPRVGGYHDPNYEAIVTLHPDVVLVSDFRPETSERLAVFGVEVRAFPHNRLEDVFQAMEGVAGVVGKEAAALQITMRIRERIAEVKAATAGKPRERVLLVVGRDLSDESLSEVYASGPVGFLNDLLEAAGATNALASGPADYPILTAEGILNLQPDRIFEILDDANAPQVADGTALRAWRAMPHRDFVSEGKVHQFCADYMNIPGPRLGLILEDFLRMLHPDLAAAA